MKTFVQFLTEAQSKVTIDWMEEHYKKYNEELFNNELPENIELGFIRERGDALGLQGFKKSWFYGKDKMKNDMYQMYIYEYDYSNAKESKGNGWSVITGYTSTKKYITNASELDPYIHMSPKYNFSDFQKEDTLIHEMIHLWVSKDGLQPKRGHGKEFKRKCKEIREKAKKLYGKDYDLQTKAVSHDEEDKSFEYTEEVKKQLQYEMNKAAKRGGGVYSVYIELDKSKMPRNTQYQIKMLKFTKRFFFCTKNRLELILGQVKKSANAPAITNIWVNNSSYIPMCNKFGRFKTVNNYNEFWDANEFDEDILKDNARDIFNDNLNEGLIDGIKKLVKRIMNIFIKVPKGAPLDNFNAEDALNYADELGNSEDSAEEFEGSAENNKKAIKLEE